MNNQMFLRHPKSLKTRFALRFVRSLKFATTRTPSMPTLATRSRLIKRAADVSMASAVSPRSSWTRAVLRRARRVHVLGNQKAKRICTKRDEGELMGVDKLRRVVPGGESMDLFKLLEETAHYMKCLSTQVEVMQGGDVEGGSCPCCSICGDVEGGSCVFRIVGTRNNKHGLMKR